MPFLINTLGNDIYGLWVIVGSVVASFYILDFGFSQAVTRYVTKYIHLKKYSEANKIINTSLLIYSILGGVILIIIIIFSQYGAEKLIEDSDNISLVQTILLISGLALAIEFPAKSLPGIIAAYMRYDFIAKIGTAKIIIDALLIYFLLSNGYGIIAMAVVTFATGITSTLIYTWFTTKIFKDFELKAKHVDPVTAKSIFHFSKWVFIFDMSAMLHSKIDLWLIAFYLNNSILTIYYVAVRLTDFCLQFLVQATGITGPIFTELYAKKEFDKLYDSVSLFIKIDVVLGAIFFSGFFLLGESFIIFWMGDHFDSGPVQQCLIALLIGRLAVYISSPLYSLLLTTNKHKVGSFISLAETSSSAILCWFLIPEYGIVGAAISMSAPYLFGRLIAVPYYTCKYVGVKLNTIMYRSFGFIILSSICTKILSLTIVSQLDASLLSILLYAILITTLHLLMSPLVFTKSERKMIINRIVKKIGK